jgi:hypothetical protein
MKNWQVFVADDTPPTLAPAGAAEGQYCWFVIEQD